MAHKLVIDGYYTDRPVAGLGELTNALRRWRPDLSIELANRMLVSPPVDLGRLFAQEEARRAADELESLGLRVTLTEQDDPTWWRDRDSETALGRESFATASASSAQHPPAEQHPASAQPSHAMVKDEDSAPYGTPAPSAVNESRPGNLWEVWTEVILQPSRFFASPLIREGGGSPIVFAVVVSIIAALLAAPGNHILGSLVEERTRSLAMEILTGVLSAPLLTLLFLVFSAAMLHIVARIFGGQGSYGVAFRIMAYASAVSVFQVLPGIGHTFMLIFYYLYSIAGLQGGYRLTPVKAAAAVMLPIFVLISIIALALVILLFVMGVAGLRELLGSMPFGLEG
jgi:hypothetical protein